MKNKFNQSVQIGEYSRPIKIAYLVPIEESVQNHWIIDAIFYESYTRWGGASTLLIPFEKNKILKNEFENWLEFFDPDFIYSYIELDEDFIIKCDEICHPIAFVKHNEKTVTRWQDLLPRWSKYFSPVQSLSTMLSPNAEYSRNRAMEDDVKRVLLTQYKSISEERFLSDNFGISHSVGSYTNPVAGLFETLCLVDQDIQDSVKAGTWQISKISEILRRINSGNVTTFSKLSKIHTNGVPRVQPDGWANSFTLVIGESCLDRINFWNGRNLAPSWFEVPASIILRKDVFNDEEFLKEIGRYFNKYNFLGDNNSSPRISIKSSSLNESDLTALKEKISKFTNNSLVIGAHNFNVPICPEIKDYVNAGILNRDPKVSKIFDEENQILAERPMHFKYTPPKFDAFNDGAWAVDLFIQRHASLSKYSNVTDAWQLPRCNKVCRAFTSNLSKVSKNGLLTIVPENTNRSFISGATSSPNPSYKLSLPTDLDFFRSLVGMPGYRDPDDFRSKLPVLAYDDLNVSDKGQNLRGIVSMFDRFPESYEMLTHKVWRTVLRTFYRKEAVSFNEIFSVVPNGHEFKERVRKELGLANIGAATKYIKYNFIDTLEYLIKKNVVFQVHRWRCSYCGHINILSIDELNKKNECGICSLEYFVPIDLDWHYKINSFVSASLCERHGLPVLWALGLLHQSCVTGSFYFLPEVDLFLDVEKPDSREEIDIICVKEGLFCIVEVKKSASQITLKNDQVEKFIKKIQYLKPNLAFLMFESLSEETEGLDDSIVKRDLENIIKKIKEESKIVGLKVSYVVANEIPDYRDGTVDLGFFGKRTQEVY